MHGNARTSFAHAITLSITNATTLSLNHDCCSHSFRVLFRRTTRYDAHFRRAFRLSSFYAQVVNNSYPSVHPFKCLSIRQRFIRKAGSHLPGTTLRLAVIMNISQLATCSWHSRVHIDLRSLFNQIRTFNPCKVLLSSYYTP